jgi:hypothetical protein
VYQPPTFQIPDERENPQLPTDDSYKKHSGNNESADPVYIPWNLPAGLWCVNFFEVLFHDAK